MTIQQIQYFLAIIERGSFTLAANELFISQSSLSKQIQSLEQELGEKLFIRNTRGVALTATGFSVQLHMRKILAEHKKMLAVVEKCRRNSTDTIFLGAIPVLNHYKITDFIAEYQRLHPSLTIDITETSTSTILQLLDQFKVDIGIIRTDLAQDTLYNVYPLLNDEFVLITSNDHPLAQRGEINLAEAENEKFILMSADPYHAKYYADLISNAGISPVVQYANMRLVTICAWIKKSKSVSIIMKRVAEYINDPDISIVLLSKHPRLSLVAVTRKENLSIAAQSFVDNLTKASKRLG